MNPATTKPPPPGPKSITISIATLCQALGIGRSTAFKMVRERQVSSLLLGRKRLITVESVEALIASRQVDAQEGQH